jgi:glycoside/pentoside/hexuronide:cation symporter, GPH family
MSSLNRPASSQQVSASPQVSAFDAPGKLRVIEKVGYGLGDTASNLYWKFFEFFLMYFYTDVFGISARAAGTMLLVTKIWDAINDPVFGYMADRTRTAWGRFRPYLVWMSVPFAVTGILTFYTPNFSEPGKLIYAYVTYTLVMMAYTAINIPYGSLLGVITGDSLERTSVSTYRFVAAFAGGIVVQYFTLKLVDLFGGVEMVSVEGVLKPSVKNPQAGFFWTMVVYSLCAVVLFGITFLTTRERVQPETSQDSTLRQDLRFLLTSRKLHQLMLIGMALLIGLSTQFDLGVLRWLVVGYLVLSTCSFFISKWAHSSIAESHQVSTLELDINDLLGNRPWMVLFVFGLFQLMAGFIRGGATMYYFKYFVGDDSHVPVFFVSASLAAIAGMLLTKPLAAIFGKKMLMIGMNVGTAICTALFFFLDSGQIQWMFALAILGAFISGPSPVLLWAMYADVADYSEWKHRRRATGLVFSAATFSQKMGVALGAAMTGWILHGIGYEAPKGRAEFAQSDLTLEGLKVMMSLLPAALLLAAAITLCFYGINQALMWKIEAELQERRKGSIAGKVAS